MKILARKIMSFMWARGMPCNDARYVNVMRAAVKAGLSYDQAFMLACEAYDASKGYTFNLTPGSRMYAATRQRNAQEHPNSKDAEDLRAEFEGRPSRWGTPEFHRGH